MSLQLRLNIDKDKHGGDLCLLALVNGTPTTNPGPIPHILRDEVIELLLYFYDTSTGSAVAYTNAELSVATFSFRSDGLPASAASGFAWSSTYWTGTLNLATILTTLAETLEESDEETVNLDFVFTTTGGESYCYRVPVIFHDRADEGGSGTVGPYVPTGWTFAESPVGHLWAMQDGEPVTNISSPGSPWE